MGLVTEYESETAPEGLPPPSPELVLLRVHVEATLQVLGRKRAERYLRIVSETLASEENLARVLPFRPKSEHAALARARREAMYWFRQALPAFIARIPPE